MEALITTTYTAKQLKEIIWKTGSCDKRFLPLNRGGVFKYFYLEHSILNSFTKDEDLLFPAAVLYGQIIALAELHKNPYNKKAFWISFASVDPYHQHKGYGSMLVKELFKAAKEHNIDIESSSYSEEGMRKLKPVLNREAKSAGVNFLDTDSTI